MAAKAKDVYPLDDAEKKLFLHAMIQSGALLAAAAVVLLMVLTGWQTGDWVYAFFGFGWLNYIVERLFLSTLWFVWPFVLVGVFALASVILKHTVASYERSTMEQRQGMMGEMIRLPLPTVLLAIPFTNIFEEVLFRGALMGLVMQLCAPLGTAVAAAVALAVSSALFWFSHAQYRDLSTTVITLALALILGSAYLVSGSLLVCIIAHVAYNWALLAYERREMRRDPDYFGGKVPYTVVQDMMSAGKGNQPPFSS